MDRIEILRAPLLDHPGIAHGFTTRRGGVSRGPYESLNLSWSSGDEKAAVYENRIRVARALRLPELVFANQVHGNAVVRVDRAPESGRPVGPFDALITDRPGLGLVAQTADCAPVLILDPRRPAVAAVHSGWRGVVHNVAAAAVSALAEAYGSERDELIASIGPTISRANYRVGPDVLGVIEAEFGKLDNGLIGPSDADGGAHLDISEAVNRQLVSAGLRPENIARLPACTFADPRFFSSRRARGLSFGAQGGIIGISVPGSR